MLNSIIIVLFIINSLIINIKSEDGNCHCPEYIPIIQNTVQMNNNNNKYKSLVNGICPTLNKSNDELKLKHFKHSCVCGDEKCPIETFQVPINITYNIIKSFKMCINGPGEGFSDWMRRDGFYDAWHTIEFSFLFQSQEEGVFVDIGANVGMFTLLAASLGRKVYSVEPTKPTLKNLKSSIRINNFDHLVTVFGFAISDVVSTAQMSPYWKSLGGTQVMVNSQDHENNKDWLIKSGSVIPMLPLDLLPLPEKILLLKIDVEGFEGYVIKGGLNTIKKSKYVALEYSTIRLINLNCNGLEYIETIINNGFSPVISFRSLKRISIETIKEWIRTKEVFDLHFIRNN